MKVLIVGSGGREHAIAASVAKSPKADKIYCAPGNAGIAEYAECVDIGAMEFDKAGGICQGERKSTCASSEWTTRWWAVLWTFWRMRESAHSARERMRQSSKAPRHFPKI